MVKLGRQPFVDLLSKSLFEEPTCFTAIAAAEAFGLDLCLPGGGHEDLNLFHIAPPTFTVNLMDPSCRGCSVTLKPFLRAWTFVASTA